MLLKVSCAQISAVIPKFRLKSKMNVMSALTERTEDVVIKVEMDRSYENEDESGFVSSANEVSTSTSSAWQFYEGEIADPNQFDPPVLQSSNLFDKKCRMVCSVSAIERDTDLTSSKCTTVIIVRSRFSLFRSTF